MLWLNCMTMQTIQSLQRTTADNCNSLREIKLRSLESHHLVPYVRLTVQTFPDAFVFAIWQIQLTIM